MPSWTTRTALDPFIDALHSVCSLSPAHPQLRIRNETLLESLDQFGSKLGNREWLLRQVIAIKRAIALGVKPNQVNLPITVQIKVMPYRPRLRISPDHRVEL